MPTAPRHGAGGVEHHRDRERELEGRGETVDAGRYSTDAHVEIRSLQTGDRPPFGTEDVDVELGQRDVERFRSFGQEREVFDRLAVVEPGLHPEENDSRTGAERARDTCRGPHLECRGDQDLVVKTVETDEPPTVRHPHVEPGARRRPTVDGHREGHRTAGEGALVACQHVAVDVERLGRHRGRVSAELEVDQIRRRRVAHPSPVDDELDARDRSTGGDGASAVRVTEEPLRRRQQLDTRKGGQLHDVVARQAAVAPAPARGRRRRSVAPDHLELASLAEQSHAPMIGDAQVELVRTRKEAAMKIQSKVLATRQRPRQPVHDAEGVDQPAPATDVADDLDLVEDVSRDRLAHVRRSDGHLATHDDAALEPADRPETQLRLRRERRPGPGRGLVDPAVVVRLPIVELSQLLEVPRAPESLTEELQVRPRKAALGLEASRERGHRHDVATEDQAPGVGGAPQRGRTRVECRATDEDRHRRRRLCSTHRHPMAAAAPTAPAAGAARSLRCVESSAAVRRRSPPGSGPPIDCAARAPPAGWPRSAGSARRSGCARRSG